MAKITFEIDDKLNQKFRKTIASSKGLYRGAIQEALIESINLWIKHSKIQKSEPTKKEIKLNEDNKNL
ncbi:MAG TPA: hypothetical protein VFK40_10355 [Nitrososphaeraceae archaeon]|nr:hypothetical protein [Nitrososphaeraceae archaeon]